MIFAPDVDIAILNGADHLKIVVSDAFISVEVPYLSHQREVFEVGCLGTSLIW